MTEQNKGVEVYQADLHESQSGLQSQDAIEIANFLGEHVNYSEPGQTIYNTALTQLSTTYPTAAGPNSFYYYFRENGRGGWERVCHERKSLDVSMPNAKTVVVAVAWEQVIAA